MCLLCAIYIPVNCCFYLTPQQLSDLRNHPIQTQSGSLFLNYFLETINEKKGFTKHGLQSRLNLHKRSCKPKKKPLAPAGKRPYRLPHPRRPPTLILNLRTYPIDRQRSKLEILQHCIVYASIYIHNIIYILLLYTNSGTHVYNVYNV